MNTHNIGFCGEINYFSYCSMKAYAVDYSLEVPQ